MKRLVIGMAAHVDSGKTTLSEAMLYRSGEIRKQGRVDNGDAFLDTYPVERSRGITVFSKQAVMHCGDGEYTILDTPGHADFSAETERALSVFDYAVLVISGTDIVQSHTEVLWRLLQRYGIPAFVFVNKMDISPFEKQDIIKQLKDRLSEGITDFSDDDLYDTLSLASEEMMNEFLETGGISDGTVKRGIACGNIFPCYFGSALKNIGIDEFLRGLDRFTEEKKYPEEFGARVFKITEEQGVRLAHMKITGGSLRVRMAVGEEKVGRIRVYSGAKYSCPDNAAGGTVCAAEGLESVRAGQGLGFEKNSAHPVLEPVMTYRMILPDNADPAVMLQNMYALERENAELHVVWNSQLRQIHLRLMGKIQLEILTGIIRDRFGINVTFADCGIAYRETVGGTVIGSGHYEPLRHYAEVRLRIDPLPPGSGIQLGTECGEDMLDRNFQRLILSVLENTTHAGVLTGSPLTDVRITLISGKAHKKHTEGGDFRQAACRAVRQGLMKAESVLLEPWYDFTLEVPSENTGRALSDLQRMCAEFSAPEIAGDTSIIKGAAPVSEMASYHSETAGYTKGRGRLFCAVKGYFPCHNSDDVIQRIGYDCGGDTENPADSVFCSHGAGYIVKWDEADGYMHTSADNAGDETVTGDNAPTPAQIARYRARLYDDNELMAIFERTYGKIDRDPRAAMRRPPEPQKYKAKPLPAGPEYLLVDGYNIIFSWEELKNIARDNLDAARSSLINILCNYQGFKQCELILVFDAYKVKGNHRETERVCNISVVYTKEAETADMYIEKVTHELAKTRRVRVATSDGTEQLIILGNGAYRVSSAEFHEEVKAVEKAIRSIIGGG
ncbi:MAG: TetM/TetW/TetO/TetS family tetracycline resistance ribosomal protection protein [Ruminococcus sp.]|nr:TetM/TetW/TetO/TetS family tetracycline resistance ribosomal protection protein [Ruminococcus sp.]